MRKPTKRELDELCRVIYETDSLQSPSWDRIIQISANAESVTKAIAVRVWRWHQEKKQESDFL